jgi:hypothetical protein
LARWRVLLQGERFDLEELPKLFTDPVGHVIEDADGFYLEASQFEGLEDAVKVTAAANRILDVINGAARLVFSSFQPVGVAAVVEPTTGDRHISVAINEGLRIRSKVGAVIVHADGTPTPPPTQPIVSNDWLRLALDDEAVAQVLRLLGKKQVTWFDLYKLMELLEARGGRSVLAAAMISKNELGRFTQTANSMGALGDLARHARPSIPAPKHPMRLSEASVMLHKWARAWLANRSPRAAV